MQSELVLSASVFHTTETAEVSYEWNPSSPGEIERKIFSSCLRMQ